MALLWLRFALGCYFIGLIYAFFALRRTSDLFSRIALHAASLGMVFHFVSLVELFLSGHVVWASVHTGESLLPFFSMTFFMRIYAFYKPRAPGVVCFPIVFFLTFVAPLAHHPLVFPAVELGGGGRRGGSMGALWVFCRHRGLGGKLFLDHPQVCRLMRYQLIGVNHRSAPLEVRERLAIPESRLPDACRDLTAHPGVEEGMIISTCNRVEMITHTTNGSADLRGFLHDHFHLTGAELDAHLYEFREKDAVRHLFRVASSLDSMVVGEAQILGQVKEAYATARAVGSVRGQLDQLFTRAFAVAKRVRSETAVGSSSVSIASVAVELAKKIFGTLQGKTVFIVGAGKMSELAARHLMAHGCASIFVANRTYERAIGLAEKFNGQAIKFDDLYENCDRADIVITSTGAPDAIFRREHGEHFLARRKNRPMFFIDIAVPRDVAP